MVFLLSGFITVLLAADTLGKPTPKHTSIQKRGIRASAVRHIPRYANVSSETGAVYSNFDGGGWILPVLIGGQQVTLNLDTGSSDL